MGKNLILGYKGKGNREEAGTKVNVVLTGHPVTQIKLSQGKVGAASPPPATPGAGNRTVPTTDTFSFLSWKFKLY